MDINSREEVSRFLFTLPGILTRWIYYVIIGQKHSFKDIVDLKENWDYNLLIAFIFYSVVAALMIIF
jgi:hypothetical protein